MHARHYVDRAATVAALALVLLSACAPTAVTTPSHAASAPAAATPVRSPGGDAVVDVFLSEFAAAQPPFHVAGEIRATGSASFEVTIEMDASGADFKGTVVLDTGEEATELEIVYVDGTGYGREEGLAWQLVPDYRPTQPVNPFSRLDPSSIDYEGSFERDGETLHRLRTTKWIGDDPEDLDLASITDPEIVDPVFDIVVGDDGIPRDAQLRFSVIGTEEGQPVRIDLLVDYTFSRVGQPVEIVAPF